MKPDLIVLHKWSRVPFHVQGRSVHASCNCLSTVLAHFPHACWLFPTFLIKSYRGFIGISKSQALPMSPHSPSSTLGCPLCVIHCYGRKPCCVNTVLPQTYQDKAKMTQGKSSAAPGAAGMMLPRTQGRLQTQAFKMAVHTDSHLVRVEKGTWSKWGFLDPFQKMLFHPKVCQSLNLHFKHAPQGTETFI